MKSFFFYLFLFSSWVISAQNMEQQLSKHQDAYHLEKIYISHNQPYYAPGDTLYGTVFLVNGRTHQYFEGTPIIYVDWITEKGSILESYKVKIEDGKADLSIPMLREFGVGRFYLRAYTQYQKNFDEGFIFQKEIKVIGEKPLEKKILIGDKTAFKLRFFPEGGQLVAGLASTVAFKAEDGQGTVIEVTGVLLDQNNKEIAQFKSFNEGIGLLNFKPEAGQKYQAKVNWNGLTRTFDLPQILSEGYVLKAIARKKESITLQLFANTKKALENCTLIGHLRGQPFLNQSFSEGNTQKLLLDRTQIPSGVLHFTLFDAKDRPVCERLVFNENPAEQIQVTIDFPKTNYSVKDLVTTNISAKKSSQLINGTGTISVFNKDIFTAATSGVNIKNYLLLQSDLKGRIDNINQYFEKNDAKSRTLLDYLMLTHGWRRFNWQDVLVDQPKPISFPTQESISFAGSIKKDNNRASPVKADVFLNILDGKHFAAVNLTTDEDGLFYFKGFDLPDSTEILIQANVHNPKKKAKLNKGEAGRTGNKNVQIEMLNLHDLNFNDTISLKGIPFNKQEQISFATEVNRIRKVDTIYHPEWLIDLDAVTVRGKRIAESRKKEAETKKMFKDRGLFYSANSEKIYMDDLVADGATYTNIYNVIRDRVGGAQIINTGEGKQVLLRANSSINNPTYATIELNGTLISNITAESIVPSTVAMIDVKKGLSTSAIYGEAGNGGIITIITKDPSENVRKVRSPGILTIQHSGYHSARTFFAPDYSLAGVDKAKPDYRTTLYWDGGINLGENPFPIQFYTGDKLSEFLIYVEGISDDGVPFVGQQIIKVGQ